MVINKRWFLRGFLTIEVMLFLFFYLFSSNGIKAIALRRLENQKLQEEISVCEAEIHQLEVERNAWTNDSFYKERVAREQLQMARPSDEVYIMR